MISFLLFVGIVILLFWVGSLSGRIKALEQRPVITAGKAPAEDLPVHPQTAQPQHGLFQGGRLPQTELHAVPIPPYQPGSAVHADAPALRRSDEEMETFLAANWAGKIGVVAILLGMAFFFKYGVDQGWITPAARVIIGFLVSGLFVVLGWLWRNKYGRYADAIMGGGTAILYFTIYAAFDFYNLFPQWLSLALMVAASLLSVWLARARKSLPLAVLGLLGAYSAPMVLSSGQNHQILLFVYLMLLNFAVLWVLARNFWPSLLYFALVASFIDFVLWAGQFSDNNNALISAVFLLLNFVLFAAIPAVLLRKHNNAKTLPVGADGTMGMFFALSGLLYASTSASLLYASFRSQCALVFLAAALAAFACYMIVDRLEFKAVNYSMTLVGSVLAVSASYCYFHGQALALSLVLFADFGIICAALFKRIEFRIWGLCILLIALFMVFLPPYSGTALFLLNVKFGLMLLTAASLIFASYLYAYLPAAEAEKGVAGLLAQAGALAFWAAVSLDINHSFTGYAGQYSLGLWWIVFPVILAIVNAYYRKKGLAALVLALMALGLIRVLILPYNQAGYNFIFNAKFGLMFLETAAILFMAFLLPASRQSDPEKDGTQTIDALKVAGSLLLWFAFSWELVHYFNGAGSASTGNLTLSLWWVIYSAALITYGAIRKSPVFRKVAIALFLLSILKVFLYDVQALDTVYRVVSFIVLGIILLSVSFAYQKNREKINEFLEGKEKEIKNI